MTYADLFVQHKVLHQRVPILLAYLAGNRLIGKVIDFRDIINLGIELGDLLPDHGWIIQIVIVIGAEAVKADTGCGCDNVPSGLFSMDDKSLHFILKRIDIRGVPAQADYVTDAPTA